jgi:hypothetical protein
MRLDRVRLDETAKAREIIDPHAHAFRRPRASRSAALESALIRLQL